MAQNKGKEESRTRKVKKCSDFSKNCCRTTLGLVMLLIS